LPPLLRHLERDAPRMRLICTPIQFRTVVEACRFLREAIVEITDGLKLRDSPKSARAHSTSTFASSASA